MQKISELLQGIWPLILGLITLIVMWTNLQGQVSAQGVQINSLQTNYTQMAATESDINVSIGEIKTNIGWIKNKLQITTGPNQ